MSKKINFDSLRDKIEQIRYSVSLGQKIIHEVSLPADWTETECLAAMEELNLDHANVVHRNLAHGLLHLYSDTMAQFSERFSFDILVAKGFASGGNTTTEMQAHLAALQIQMDALQASQEAQGRDIKTMETTHGAKLDELLISVRAFTGPTGASAATSSGGSTSSRPAPSRRGTAAAATSSSNA